MYERIASNVRKSWGLILIFVLLVMGVGWLFGRLTGYGPAGLILAGVISLGMVWGSYFGSDRIALAMSRAKPADGPEFAQLRNIVEALAIAAGMPPPRVYVVYDDAPNAFATGRNPDHGAIAVTTGLLAKMNRDELQGVIAHELSHIKNRDTLVMTLAVTLVGVVVLLADWLIRSMFWGGDRDRGGGLGLPFAIIGMALLLVAPLFAQLLQFAISRRREFLADADGVFLTRHPNAMVAALAKLRDDHTVVRTASRATSHLWIESPMALSAADRRPGAPKATWLNRLFETHPPLDERIRALQTSSLQAPPPQAPAAAQTARPPTAPPPSV